MRRPVRNIWIGDTESILGPGAVEKGRVVLEEHDADAEHYRVQNSRRMNYVSSPAVVFVLLTKVVREFTHD